MKEIWKNILGYKNLYKVSNKGRVKSLARVIIMSNGRKRNYKEKILKPAIGGSGYLLVGLYKKKNQKIFLIHQLVAMSFLNHQTCGHKKVINHKNFIRTDNRLENLEVISARENTNLKHLKSSSQYTGVSWHKRDNIWQSQILYKGKTEYLGRFKKEMEAKKAYQKRLQEILN